MTDEIPVIGEFEELLKIERSKDYPLQARVDLLEAIITSNGKIAEGIRKVGKEERSQRRLLATIRDRASTDNGYDPRAGLDGFTNMRELAIHGRSSLVRRKVDEGVILQWIKEGKEGKQLFESLHRAAKAFIDREIEPVKPKRYRKRDLNTDIIPWFNIGDGHLGMLAHEAEVGHNFDLRIAQKDLCTAIDALIERLPDCERCVLQDMGDMTHYENISGTTDYSGHQLDFDGRFPKMIDIYVDVICYMVDRLLEKFKYLDCIINQGNHSRTNDIWARVFLQRVYKDCDRLTVLDNSSVFITYRMGNTFVLCHHSDKCKPARLVDVMTSDFAQDFGETRYHYIDIGHIHHRMVAKEMSSITVESFNQIALSDKYAHDLGYRSRSCLTVVERSKTYGEVGRKTITHEEVRDIINNAKPGTSAKARRKVYTV